MKGIDALFRRASARLKITDRRRWKRNAYEEPPWGDSRTRLIAELVPAGSSVLDLGAGRQTLRRYIAPSCIYQPCDLVQMTPDTWLMDFNAGLYPTVPEPFDVVVMSGVLEYARRPEELLRRIHSFGRTFLLSYNDARPDYPVEKRRANGWLSHLNGLELEALLSDLGYKFEVVDIWEDRQPIYRLRSG